MAQYQQSHQQYEFLPLCDVLFNIISLASYFCDVVFDLAMGYALSNHPSVPPILFPLSMTFVVGSLVISQLVSLRWYLWGTRGKLIISTNERNINIKEKLNNISMWCIVFLHTSQVGVLWRYFKLFIPVDLTYVKHEVRELCVLRLIHGFCEAAPMLLLQLYFLSIGINDNNINNIMIKDSKRELIDNKDINSNSNNNNNNNHNKLAELTTVSAGLSLWSVCWAVASFSKGAARLRNIERLVLTWLGVLAQLIWRLGTVSARVGVLIIYASLYGGQWLLVVLALHWLSMLTWLLLTPDGLFYGDERLSIKRKIFLASLLAFIYIFVYINLHETNHRQKMIIFYTVMFLENILLISVWTIGIYSSNLQQLTTTESSSQSTSSSSTTSPSSSSTTTTTASSSFKNHPRPIVIILLFLTLFFGGLLFMGLYYRFFHVRRLRYDNNGQLNDNNITATTHNNDGKNCDYNNDKKFNNSNKKNNVTLNQRKVKLSNNGIPGVFNCRFANPTVTNHNRKKKKPTTFVPPPPPTATTSIISINDTKQWANTNYNSNVNININSNNHNNINTNNNVNHNINSCSSSSSSSSNPNNSININNNISNSSNSNNIRNLIPFWKRPLSSLENHDNKNVYEEKNDSDVLVGTLNINLIREKLREKKQQQLRELQAIQEEIKEGKLVPPPSASTSSFSSSLSQTNQQPPPNAKLHTTPHISQTNKTSLLSDITDDMLVTSWPPLKMHCNLPSISSSHHHPTYLSPTNLWNSSSSSNSNNIQRDRPETPEILLLPQSLSHHYPNWISSNHRLRSINKDDDNVALREQTNGNNELSDKEESSQISSCQSYTVNHREMANLSNSNKKKKKDDTSSKYRGNISKLQTSRFYLPSTNSSDGDVDSADNDDETDIELKVNHLSNLNDNDNENQVKFISNNDVDNNQFSSSSNDINTPTTSSISAFNYINNYYGPRSNQLLKNKIKHETKL